jgi:hypothetical protein
MKLWRGVVAATLAVTFIVGVASAASAQEDPGKIFSVSSIDVAAAVPGATARYRVIDGAVVVVVPDTLAVTPETLTTIANAVWASESARFDDLEVQQAGQVIESWPYSELRQMFGPGPRRDQTVQEIGDFSLEPVAEGYFTWIKAVAFAVVVGVVTVMLVVVLFVLVDAQWRRVRETSSPPS